MFVGFTGHRCGTRSARARGCLCDPCKGSVVALGMPGGEREARAQAEGRRSRRGEAPRGGARLNKG